MYSYDKQSDIRRLCTEQLTADLFKFKAGDELLVVGNSDTPYFQFEVVTAEFDTEEGIFETRPFVKVINAKGVTCCMHASRCVPLKNVGKAE